MPYSSRGSISVHLERLVSGEDEALEELWAAYFEGLLTVARKQLTGLPRRSFDEEDVALSVFEALRRGAEEGRFANLRDRTDLWKLLVTITQQKSIDRIRRETAQKRGGGQTRGESVFAADGDAEGFAGWIQSTPGPSEVTAMEEEISELLGKLRDDSLRRVAVLRLDGHTNEEIAAKLGVASRTVERKLRLIRSEWQQEIDSLSH